MTKTIEDMVQELDEKFEGFKNCYNLVCKTSREFSIFTNNTNIDIDTNGINFDTNLWKKGMRFFDEDLDKVIKTVHNYFITQGNDL